MGLMDSVAAFFGKMSLEGISDHIRLENVENQHTLVMKDGTLVSMIRLSGMFQVPGAEAIIETAERMRLGLSPYLSRPGHAITFNFIRDPHAAGEEVARSTRITRRTAQKSRMDVDDILAERQRILSERLTFEQTLICLYSRPILLDKEEAKLDRAAVRERMKDRPPALSAQEHGRTMESLLIRHEAFVAVVQKIMVDTAQMADLLDAREMVIEARLGITPDLRGSNDGWQPNLPVWAGIEQHDLNGIGSTVVMAPDTPEQRHGSDFSNMLPITLDRQIVNDEAHIEDAQCVRIGSHYFTSFDMSVPPEVLVDFNTMVLSMNSGTRRVPWRCTFLIEAGGVQAVALKERYLDFFTMLSRTHNERIGRAIRELREVDGTVDNVIRFRASFTTWSRSREELRVFAQKLQNAVKSWGGAAVDGMSGDPMATTISTVPGATLASTAPTGAAPLTDALCISPIGRSASPWDEGPVMFRTASGKPWAFAPGSSKQETWIYLFCGTPGSGKSVLLNAINLGTILSTAPSANGTILPKIAVVDVGSSSSGLISLVKESLPPELRHLALFKRLSMSVQDSVNVFDTPLGSRYPTPLDRSFLISFMSIICSTGTSRVSGQMTGLIGAAIDEVYERYSDKRNPKQYHRNQEPLVDDAIKRSGYTPEEDETWWDVVDQLAGRGFVYEAEIAQRHAVPLLSDLATVASQSPAITSLYGQDIKETTGEITINAFARLISEVTRDYPNLSSHTRLDLGSARIISLDLMDVAPSGDSDNAVKQTALMYMIGRQVCTKDFYQKEDDFRILVEKGGLPKQYLKYHLMRCRENLQMQKVICFDEFHRAKAAPAIVDQVERDGREGRKFNVSVNVISQLPEDFSKDMFDMASGIFVCNARGSSLEYLNEQIRLSAADEGEIRFRLTGPSQEGSPFWTAMMIKNRGQMRQSLMLTLGPIELWAFSTTAKDVALRQMVYERLGPKMGRAVLARRFPGGSAVKEIDSRIARIENEADRLGDNAQHNVIAEVLDELTALARTM